jgi:Site-specific DNA methylase
MVINYGEMREKMYYSPLRYPGGKTKIYKFVKKIIELNNLSNCEYIEPFAGGAGIAIALLLEGIVNYVRINDYSKSIFCFWDSVLNRTDDLCKLISDTPVTIDVWRHQKDVLKDDVTSLEMGFAAFFLNRTNRSGIIKNGGVIGGIEQGGTWKIDARYNKKQLIERIQKIALRKNQIEATNYECLAFIDYIKQLKKNNSLIYFDPPYISNGKRLYENYYTIADHEILSKKIKNEVSIPWILTYDKSDIIKELYKGFTIKCFELDYSAYLRRKGTEMLICDKRIELPGQSCLNQEAINMFYC